MTITDPTEMAGNFIGDRGARSPYCALALILAFGAAACAQRKPMAVAAATAQTAPSAAAPEIKTAPADAASATAKTDQTFAALSQGLSVHKFWGVVESVNEAQNDLEVKSRSGHTKDFTILSDTAVNEGGQNAAISFGGVKIGDHVRVLYAGKYAKTIHVMILPAGGA